MKRKFTAFFVVCCLLVGSASAVGPHAVQTAQDSVFPQTMTGYVCDQEGNVSEVTGYLQNTEARSAVFGNDELVATYAYDLYAEEYTNQGKGVDPTASARAYLTCTYNVSGTPSTYLLTKVSASWVDLTPTDTTKVKSTANLIYTCSGMGPNSIFAHQTSGNMTINNNFAKTTGFTKRITGEVGTMGAELTIHLSQGSTRTWDYKLPNYPVDSLVP